MTTNTFETNSGVGSHHPVIHHLKAFWMKMRLQAIPALVIGTFVFGATAGLVATRLSPRMTQLVLAVLVLILVTLLGPVILLSLLLGLSSTLVDLQRLPFLFGFSSLEWYVVLLAGLVLVRLTVNRHRREVFVRTPMDWPILLFFVFSTVSLLNAKYILGTVDVLRNDIWRALLLYLVFFAVTNLIKTRRQLMSLVGGMSLMATIVAALVVAQQAVGPGVNIIPGQEQVSTATVLGRSLSGVARINVSGTAIVYVMLLPVLILHATPQYLKGHKWLSFLPVVLLPLAIAFTFSRNLWLGAMLGGLIFVLVSRLKSGRFVLLMLALALGAVVLISLLNAYFPRIDVVAQGISSRFNSLFAQDELIYDSSTQWRLQENEDAIPRIKEYPILGMGPKAEYRAQAHTGAEYQVFYVHNAYLFLLLDVGFVGFLPFLWFSVAFLVRGISAWYTLEDPVLKSVVVSFAVSYIAILVASTATPKLLQPQYVPLIAVIMGINEVAMRLDHELSHESKEL